MGHRDNDLSCSLSSPTGGYNKGNDLLLSLSHSLCIQLRYIHIIQPHHTLLCPKSYLYTYEFRTIYTYGPKGLTRTDSRMCPFQQVEGGYHRAFSHPVHLTSHPEGPGSQQTPPSLRQGMSCESYLLPSCFQLVGCQYLGQHI